MSRFQVLEGKLSPLYNNFEDYTFTDCIATDTRLMGAVAMCLRFCADDGSGRVLHVLLHLDYSEYGVDEYLEYFHDTEDEAFSDEALWKDWTHIYGGLGGELQEVPLDTAVYHINQALAVSNARFRDTDEEIVSFQTFARTKMSQLLASLPEAMPDGPEHFGRLCKAPLSVRETMHYFIMRLADLDFTAAAWLSDIPVTVLRNNAVCRNGIQTLMKDTITQDGLSPVWHSRTLTMDDLQYYFYTTTLRIRFDAKRKRHVIQEFSVDSA
ncbi:MAG: hypothetical protein IJH91_08195 [Mogibacterium sp.]|nr:hypothetical protein [Mogibacterium sp.]